MALMFLYGVVKILLYKRRVNFAAEDYRTLRVVEYICNTLLLTLTKSYLEMTNHKMIAEKYCSKCNKKRSLLERVTDTDRDMCETCYRVFVNDIKEKSDKGNHRFKQ
ncbi:hypothetical protein [Pantoea sp. FN0307]|uniref:hypothetical protein n=1 Tax=unclassified Pantoea TaxID=2630326 RepID=UPI003CEF5AC0